MTRDSLAHARVSDSSALAHSGVEAAREPRGEAFTFHPAPERERFAVVLRAFGDEVLKHPEGRLPSLSRRLFAAPGGMFGEALAELLYPLVAVVQIAERGLQLRKLVRQLLRRVAEADSEKLKRITQAFRGSLNAYRLVTLLLCLPHMSRH